MSVIVTVKVIYGENSKKMFPEVPVGHIIYE